jgi:hypothetical protein
MPNILALVVAATCAVHAGGETVVLEGVDHYRVCEPMFEGLRVVLAQRGETYSPAYIQGISGAAFRIAGICPCAPTCNGAMSPQDLLRLIGYEFEECTLTGEGIDAQRDVPKVVERVKQEIRAGRAVLVWHAFTNAEWDVVSGFDDEKAEFLGFGSYTAGHPDVWRAAHTRMAKAVEICPAYGALLIGRKTGEFDARAAELSALEEAIRHCHSPRDPELDNAGDKEAPWKFRKGKACYDAWGHNYRANPGKVPEAGDRYCLGVYRSTHRMAAEFLREIAPKYPPAAEHFGKAAALFGEEADALDRCYERLCGGWEGWKEPNPEKAENMAEALQIARKRYGAAVKEIERGLREIDPERCERAHHPQPTGG